MSWEQAGRAWSDRAADFAYLVEPFTRPVIDVLLDELNVGRGQGLLDEACGSGYAAMVAAQRGAKVTGIDAAAGLIDIARERNPAGDFRVGDMDELPFDDESFDVVTTIAGIVAGRDAAAREAFRVLRPGGRFGLASWGSPKRREHLLYFMALVDISPPDHIEESLAMMATGRPGTAESLLENAGFEVLQRGTLDVTSEWPDVDIAVRACTSIGASWPARQHVGDAHFADVLTEALSPGYRDGVGVRLTSEFMWLTARKPD
jgi:SAM-dependent methyltransferase